MARINLLPWRAERRQRQKKEFVQYLAIAVVAAGLVVFGGLRYINDTIAYQNARNDRLQDEIRVLNRRIKEIQELQAQKKRLENRMAVIQDLQLQRPGIVHLFDELVTTLPDGVYLTSVDRSGGRVQFEGKADSNARVSAYMKNIARSEWFGEATLDFIEANEVSGVRIQTFELRAPQTTP